MNNKGAGTNLTFLIIGIAAFVVVITILTSAYVEFKTTNGASVDSEYLATYNNISDKRSDLNELEEDVTSVNVITSLPVIASSFINSLAFGLTAITNMFSLLTIIPSLINTISERVAFLPAELIWFAIFAITIFIAMKILKAIRGTPEEA